MNKKTGNPIKRKEEVKNNPDPKIDEDFEGYPNGPAKEETIKPKTSQQKKTADLDNKDGEKNFNNDKEHLETDEQESDGSANAFDDK